MKDQNKTKVQLIAELKEMRQQVSLLENSEHLNRLLHTIRNMNQLITKEKNRDGLCKRACEILVETRDYHSAWIVLLDLHGGYLNFTEAGLSKEFNLMRKLLEQGKLPKCAKIAQKQKELVVTENPIKKCTDCPLSTNHAGPGVYTICLTCSDRIYGFLSVSIPEKSIQNKKEKEFFCEIAGGIACAIHDIEVDSKHRQMEKALRESEKTFKAIINNIGEGIGLVDKKENFIFLNPVAHEIFGVPEGSLLGRNLKDFVNEKTFKNILIQTMHRQLGNVTKYEIEIMRPDGNKRNLLVTGAPKKDSNGNITGTYGIFRDITEQNQSEKEKARLETQLHRSQKLETIGTLAGGIAHEFNNILTPIMVYTDMAILSLSLTDPLVSDLKQIMDGAVRAKKLVQQILTFSRQMEQERKPVRLSILVKEAIQFILSLIPANIEIRQQIDSSFDTVMADASQMYQVIVNLCTNAYHSMEDMGGTLTIELKKVKVNAETVEFHPHLEESEYVMLAVSDTGTGMDDSTIERSFDPFFTTKSVDKGNGLGLSVVHGIVRSHYGDIIVNSILGKGSSFQVYLPLYTATYSETEIREDKTVQCGKESTFTRR